VHTLFFYLPIFIVPNYTRYKTYSASVTLESILRLLNICMYVCTKRAANNSKQRVCVRGEGGSCVQGDQTARFWVVYLKLQKYIAHIFFHVKRYTYYF
jgi:hypothetical protein